MITLQHRHGRECTGRWVPVWSNGQRVALVCDVCEATVAPSPDNIFAALDENYNGARLERLTREGAAQLPGDGDR